MFAALGFGLGMLVEGVFAIAWEVATFPLRAGARMRERATRDMGEWVKNWQEYR